MFLNLDQQRVHYDLVGPESGPPVCMVHSLLLDSGVWSGQVPILLERGFRVLRIDISGHGGSDAPSGDYRMAQLADDVAAVVERLGLGGVHYVGVSIGAMIGQVLAARQWGALRSAMLCSSGIQTSAEGRRNWDERIDNVRRARSVLPLAASSVERWFSASFKADSEAVCQTFRESIAGTSVDGYLGCAAAIRDFEGVPLEAVQVPVLVVRGTEDMAASGQACGELATRTRGRLVELAGAGHLPNVEQPAVFNRLLSEWLQSASETLASSRG
jgi:3-oxoadipate enol-lactonase